MRNALVGIAVVGAVAVGSWGCGGGTVEVPKLSKDGSAGVHGPGATELHLAAGDVPACSGGDHEIEDLEVVETSDEVIVEASLRVEDSGLGCEIRTAHVGFVVSLDQPLGDRKVIDNSRGERRVIWSPRLREGVLRAKQLDVADAERFMLERRDAQGVSCTRMRFTAFDCWYRRSSDSTKSSELLTVSRSGQLMLGCTQHSLYQRHRCADERRRNGLSL